MVSNCTIWSSELNQKSFSFSRVTCHTGRDQRVLPFNFFGTARPFFRKIFSSKGPSLQFFDVLQQNGCSKIPKGPPFQFLALRLFFRKFVFSPKGPPSTATKMLKISKVSPVLARHLVHFFVFLFSSTVN